MTYHRLAGRLVTVLILLCIFVGVYFATGLVAAGLIYFVGARSDDTHGDAWSLGALDNCRNV